MGRSRKKCVKVSRSGLLHVRVRRSEKKCERVGWS